MSERTIARYSNNFGPLGFENPDKQGILKSVSYCIVDNMIHVFLRQDPFKDTTHRLPYSDIASALKKSVKSVTGFSPLSQGNKTDNEPGYDGYVGIWDPGRLIDLEDMVQIIKGVPELDAKWLREALESLKRDAGLSKEDGPYLDSHVNPNRHHKSQKEGWYTHSWLSGAGGSICLQPQTPRTARAQLKEKLIEAGALIDETLDEKNAIRFKWPVTKKSPRATLEKLDPIIANVPGLYQALTHHTKKTTQICR